MTKAGCTGWFVFWLVSLLIGLIPPYDVMNFIFISLEAAMSVYWFMRLRQGDFE